MRASTGFGLIMIGGLFACTTIGPGSDSPSPTAEPTNSDSPTDPTSGDGTDPTPAKASTAIVKNLDITSVSVFQAVKIDVVKSGVYVAPTKRNAPVVAKRPGMMRVYVKPGSGWKAREVTAQVRLFDGETELPLLTETKTISVVSKDEDPKTTFNIELPAEQLPAGVTFQVSLTADDGDELADGAKSTGRFPTDGSSQDLGAKVSGKVKIVVVPLQYDADGSGRKPDVSAAQLELYKNQVMRLYPTTGVEVTVHKPVSWTTAISPTTSTGFSNVLNAMFKLRQADNVDDDVYYHGVFTPTSSFANFCNGGCVAGLSTVNDDDSPQLRASVGLGYSGDDSARTMAHEVGHAHGRAHAPCVPAGATIQGVDPDYPYTQAQIGVWGYDIFDQTLISPTKGRDMMAYCDNVWVSDYTYSALFDRIAEVSTQKQVIVAGNNTSSSASAQPASRWRMASVGTDGALSWDHEDIALKAAPKGGSRISTRFLAASGIEVATRDAHFYPYDHIAGGVLFVPQESSVEWKSARVDGFAQRLVR